MSDNDTIRNRVRKLMAYANDASASDAEIENAMARAAELMDKHHIEADTLGSTGDDADLTMGDSFATSQSTRFSTWETSLGHAIANLFGCVGWYIDHATVPIRVNGIAMIDGDTVRKGRRVCFYGPAAEAAEAANLFEEWSRSIATMGMARWGGIFRGDGAQYCYGFAKALLAKARKINDARQLVKARPLPQLGDASTAIMLSDRYGLLKAEGRKFVEAKLGVNLCFGGTRSGYSGSSGAYAEGRTHGTAAEFGRNARRRQLPG